MATNWSVLIRVREHERDLQRQRLAQALTLLRDREAACETARHTLHQALAEARSAGATGLLDVRRLTAHREHIHRLQTTLEQCEASRSEASEQVDTERGLLLTAEQRLEQLERLVEQQRQAAAAQAAKRQQHELEEVWQSTRAIDRAA